MLNVLINWASMVYTMHWTTVHRKSIPPGGAILRVGFTLQSYTYAECDVVNIWVKYGLILQTLWVLSQNDLMLQKTCYWAKPKKVVHELGNVIECGLPSALVLKM
jgi:hypothetical protein